MTTPGESAIDSLSDDPTSTVKYRYFQQPPKTIFVEWSELVDLVPADVIAEGKNSEGITVGLPAEEIFEGIIPRIQYGRLKELLPEGTLQISEDRQNEFLYIPASRIAKHYQMTTLREALPEDPKPEQPAEIKQKWVITLPQPDRSQAPGAVINAGENPAVFSQPVISHNENPEKQWRDVEPMRVMTLPQPGEDRKPIEAAKVEEKIVAPKEVPATPAIQTPAIHHPVISSIENLEKKSPEVAPAIPVAPVTPVAQVAPPEVIKHSPPVFAAPAASNKAVEIPVPQPQPVAKVFEPAAVKADEETPDITATPEVEAEQAIEEPVAITPPPRTPLTLPKPDLPIVAQAAPAPESLDPQQKRRFFDRLPLFRKKSTEQVAEEAPPVIIKPIHTNLPAWQVPVPVAKKITQNLSTVVPPSEPKRSAAPDVSDVPDATNIPVSAAPVSESKVTLMVPESKESALEIRAKEEIPHQAVLQSLFMTDEALTIERTIELSSALPGVRSCVLARGAGIIASANVPEGIDVVALSTNAMAMLRQMQESLQKMGLGSIPAVTLHSEKGPVSVLPYEDLCMLIFHKDRAFIPGVRQRLQDVMKELSHANLPLALETGDKGETDDKKPEEKSAAY